MTISSEHTELPANEMSARTGNLVMVLCQTALGIAILFVWQGVSGRLVDNLSVIHPLRCSERRS